MTFSQDIAHNNERGRKREKWDRRKGGWRCAAAEEFERWRSMSQKLVEIGNHAGHRKTKRYREKGLD